ncbi:hypothetical protein DUNSADRAFT_13279 [Dunaliella salina]|uniref:Encoded protein n=1 Tax=Dunaliella salina TaxID=3046 RepID=A0ABQ7G9T8_DUNSA|nr:hypothetical protein DUNSADRAFT_13279 [Dunaliella salina]|eukprot:KAF5831340.1 hypothetical protein DUNSADRAFT_13279 [Dunaliella salina]
MSKTSYVCIHSQVSHPLLTCLAAERVSTKQRRELRFEAQHGAVVVWARERKREVLAMLSELTAPFGLGDKLEAFVLRLEDPTCLDASALVSRVWERACACQGRVIRGTLSVPLLPPRDTYVGAGVSFSYNPPYTAGALSMNECGTKTVEPAPRGNSPWERGNSPNLGASHSDPETMLLSPELMNKKEFFNDGQSLGLRKPSREAVLHSSPETLACLASPEAAQAITVHLLEGADDRDALARVPHGGPLPWAPGSIALDAMHQLLAEQEILWSPTGKEMPFGSGSALRLDAQGAPLLRGASRHCASPDCGSHAAWAGAPHIGSCGGHRLRAECSRC